MRGVSQSRRRRYSTVDEGERRRVDKESGNKRVLCKRRKEREKADSNLVSNVVLPEPQGDAGLGC